LRPDCTLYTLSQKPWDSADRGVGETMTDTHRRSAACATARAPSSSRWTTAHRLKVSGDPTSEIYTTGTTCIKGRALPRCTRIPDRLPALAGATGRTGRSQPISSEAAMDEIAASLTRIVDAHGPLSVALYSAGPRVSQCAHRAADERPFREALGNPRGWVATTSIDQPGKTIAPRDDGRLGWRSTRARPPPTCA